jgi:hypothetical protein
LFEHKREKSPVLGVASTWDSPESAQKYFEQYRQVMQGKWKKLEIANETSERIEGQGDSGYFLVWIDGVTVNQIEGWKTPLPVTGIRSSSGPAAGGGPRPPDRLP